MIFTAICIIVGFLNQLHSIDWSHDYIEEFEQTLPILNLAYIKLEMINNNQYYNNIIYNNFSIDMYLSTRVPYNSKCANCFNNNEFVASCLHGYCSECLNKMFKINLDCLLCKTQMSKLYMIKK